MATYRVVVDWQWLTRIEGNQYITDSSLQINEIESHSEKRSVHVFPNNACPAQFHWDQHAQVYSSCLFKST